MNAISLNAPAHIKTHNRQLISNTLKAAAQRAKNLEIKTILLDKARQATYWPTELLTASPKHVACDFTPDQPDLHERPKSLLPIIALLVVLTLIQLLWF